MSEFSGKCDVADFFYGKDDAYIRNCKIYSSHAAVPLRIDSRKDLIPYYSHIVGMATVKENDCPIIYLSDDSYVNQEEKEVLEIIKHDVLKAYKKCKRNHMPFIPEVIADKLSAYNSYNAVTLEIAQRVLQDGEKVSIKAIHTKIANYYRRILLQEMLSVGYSESFSTYWLWGDLKYNSFMEE